MIHIMARKIDYNQSVYRWKSDGSRLEDKRSLYHKLWAPNIRQSLPLRWGCLTLRSIVLHNRSIHAMGSCLRFPHSPMLSVLNTSIQYWVNIDSHMNFLLNQGMNPRYWFLTEPHCSTSHSQLMKFIFSNHRLQRVKWSKRVKITCWSLACGQAVWKGDLRFRLSLYK